MKRIISVFMIVLITITLLTSCSNKALEDYSNAVTKINYEKMGKESIDIKINIDYNTDGLTLEQTRKLNYYKEMIFRINNQYDMEKDKIATDIYMNLGGIGMDSYFYKDGDKEYIQIPVLKKYIHLNKQEFITDKYSNIFKSMSNKWLEALEDEDVIKGENTIIDTEDGQIKAKKVTIKINKQQLKELSEEFIKIICDSVFIEDFNSVINIDEDQKDINKEDIIKSIKDTFYNISFENFEAKAYIDFDGYLIRENMTIEIKTVKQIKGEPMSIRVSFDKSNWDIGKKQEIKIPKFTQDDIISIDELKDVEDIIGL
jgi:copper chaperone CopZ